MDVVKQTEDRSVTRGMRTRQILRLLKKHGRLPPAIICKLIEPPIQKRRLQECMARLKRDRLVQVSRLGNDRCAPFYQIHQKPYGRKRVAKVLGCTADELRLLHFTSVDHSAGAALAFWHERIEQKIAKAKVYRKHEYESFGLAKNLFDFADENAHRWPPLLVGYRTDNFFEKIYVGIVIEFSGYSHQRMMRKIKPMIKHSHLDGVLYFIYDDNPIRVIRNWSVDPGLRYFHRIKHCTDNFLGVSASDFLVKSNVPQVFTKRLGVVRLEDWLHDLSSQKSAIVAVGTNENRGLPHAGI